MGSLTAVLPQGIGEERTNLLSLVGLPSDVEHAPQRLSGVANGVIRSVVQVTNDLVVRAMQQRTKEQFDKTRGEVFPQYFHAMLALGALMRIALPKNDFACLTAQSLSELEADFRDKGAAAFGAALRDRGLFTVFALRKISDLSEEICKTEVKGKASKKDQEMAREFGVTALWARFHIDCLVKSMDSGMPIFPDVVESIEDGLRAVVNAYAWIQQGAALRNNQSEPDLAPIHWDAEDEALLADSMRDLDES